MKFSTVFSSSSNSNSSISNAFLIISIINISNIGKKISQIVVHLFRFKTRIFFLINALSFAEELPPVETILFSIIF